jgi:hypothetical protein
LQPTEGGIAGMFAASHLIFSQKLKYRAHFSTQNATKQVEDQRVPATGGFLEALAAFRRPFP